VDEAYGEFATETVLPGVATRGIPRQAVLVRTLSKAWGLAGLRLGYAVARPEMIEKMDAVRSPFNVGVWPQAAAKLLLSFDEWMESRVLSLTYIRDRFVEAVNGLGKGWIAAPSEGNFVLVHTPQERGLVQEVLRQAGLCVKFFDDLPWKGCWMRVTVGKEEDMRRVVESFAGVSAAREEGDEEIAASASA
jgi:histidinol-phosphate aminotransferase